MTTDKEAVVRTLKSILAAQMTTNIEGDEIGDDEPLIDGRVHLDSISIVELLQHVETEFEIRFEDEDLRMTTFETLGSLATAVNRHLERSPPAAPNAEIDLQRFD